MAITLDNRPAPGPARSDGAETSVTPRRFRPDIEGLRAVAVVAVLLYHAGVPGVSGGYVGVDVFFVVSGFLITGLLVREFEHTGAISIADFYARRARRILPVASVVIVATLAATSVMLGASRADGVAHDGLWTSVFAANFRFMSVGADYLNATAPPSPVQHFWSLAVEEQFYLVWPLALWLLLALGLRRTGRARGPVAVLAGAGVVTSFVWCVYETGVNANTAYFSPFTRAWELGIGAVLAVVASSAARLPSAARIALGWLGVVAIGWSVFSYDSTTVFPGTAAAVPVLGAAFVIVAGLKQERYGPEAVLGLAPMQWCGKISYSLYLWHWPILAIASWRHPDTSLTVKLVLLLVAVGLSVLSYRAVENPARRDARLLSSRRLTLALAVVTIAAVAAYCSMFVVAGRYASERAERQFAIQSAQAATAEVATSADVLAAVAASSTASYSPLTVSPPVTIAARDFSPAYSNGCLVESADTVSPTCVFGDPSATRTVVLFGDSHAAQWMTALENISTREPFTLVVLTKGNCPVTSVTPYNLGLKRDFTECTTWRDWAIKQIDRLRPDTLIMSGTFHGASLGHGVQTPDVQRQWLAGLTQTVDRVRSSVGSIAYIGDVPAHTEAVPDCLQGHPTDVRACAEPRPRAVLSGYQSAEQATLRDAGVTYVDVVPWFCSATVCPAVVHGIVTEWDDSHMTTTYSKYLGHVLGQAVGLERR